MSLLGVSYTRFRPFAPLRAFSFFPSKTIVRAVRRVIDYGQRRERITIWQIFFLYSISTRHEAPSLSRQLEELFATRLRSSPQSYFYGSELVTKARPVEKHERVGAVGICESLIRNNQAESVRSFFLVLLSQYPQSRLILEGLTGSTVVRPLLQELPGFAGTPVGRLAAAQELVNEAQELMERWNLPAAAEKVEEGLRNDPVNWKLLMLRARVLSQLGGGPEAIEAARVFESAYPLDVNARRMLRALGQEPRMASVETARNWIVARKNDPISYSQASDYLFDAEKFQEAIWLADEGLVIVQKYERGRAPVRGKLLSAKAISLEAMGLYKEAIAVHEQMLDQQVSKVKGLTGMARCYLETGRPDLAEQYLFEASGEKDGQQPHSPLAVDVLQANGKIRESYLLYRKRTVSQAIAECFDLADPVSLNLLTQQNRHKKALFISEGGPGDELRFCSIYPELATLFSHVSITADPRLCGLLTRTFPEIDFIPTPRHRREFVRDMADRSGLTDARLFQCLSDEAVTQGNHVDVVCSVLDVLADLRPDRASFRSTARRHLEPLPDQKHEWKRRLSASSRVKVGIAWRSMLESIARNRHYLDVSDLSPLSALENVEFWVLQPGVRKEELDALSGLVTMRIPEGLDLENDFEGQLALIANLDAVVSPFMTTGELSAAAGVPTALVSTVHSTMWRRFDDGSDIFSPVAKVVSGVPHHDKSAAVSSALDFLESQVLCRC